MDGFIVKDSLKRFLEEDLAWGDVTSDKILEGKDSIRVKAVIYAKEEGVMAGIDVPRYVFEILSPDIEYICHKKDGEDIKKGDVLAEVFGPASALLKGERVSLNLIQRMCGIATKTRRFVKMVEGFNVKITDTRKTMPGLRIFDKYAVEVGGGIKHRFGLADSVLIKDNHIKIAGGIKEAVERVKNKLSHTLKIEIEVENLEDLKEALEAGVDIILLDNMSPDMVRRAVEIVDKRVILEVSGGIREDNIIDYAKTGVDVISIGSLTHSVKALDISLDLFEKKKS